MTNPTDEDEPESFDEPKPKNLARYLTPNLARLAREVMRALPRNLTEFLNLRRQLFNGIWGDDLPPEKCQALLYRFGPWSELKMGILDARKLPLPVEMVPQSEDELRALCYKLLDRTGDPFLQEAFVKGWSGKVGLQIALREFCKKLWATQRKDPEFYEATLRGFHGTAVRYLVRERVPLGLTRDQAIDLILKMALIWSAHDVQATAARAHLSMTRPFGWLISGSAKRMKAGTVFAVWRPRYNILKLHLGRYRTHPETQAGKPEAKPSRHDDVATIKVNVEPSLNRSMLLKAKRRERDAAVDATRAFTETFEDEFWEELRHSTGRFDNRQQSEVWYSLTPLQMVSLAVLRLIHAETVLRDRIVALYEAEKKGETISATEFLPHSEQARPRGWEARARLLVDHLRRVVLDDSDHHSRRPDEFKKQSDWPSKNAAHITAALDFIAEAIKEPLSADPTRLSGKRRTLSLLSIAAAGRFQR